MHCPDTHQSSPGNHQHEHKGEGSTSTIRLTAAQEKKRLCHLTHICCQKVETIVAIFPNTFQRHKQRVMGYVDRETKKRVISRGRQQVAKLCIQGHPPLVPLHLPFSSCPFSLKHSDCHLAPSRVIFLKRRKPPFSLFLIWLQSKPWGAFPMWASLNQALPATSRSIESVDGCLDYTVKTRLVYEPHFMKITHGPPLNGTVLFWACRVKL